LKERTFGFFIKEQQMQTAYLMNEREA